MREQRRPRELKGATERTQASRKRGASCSCCYCRRRPMQVTEVGEGRENRRLRENMSNKYSYLRRMRDENTESRVESDSETNASDEGRRRQR